MTETLQYPKFRWFALIAMVIVTASTSSILISPAPLIPTIFTSMNWNPGATVAATMLTFQICVASFALLGGFLVDRIGPVRTWIVGLTIIIVGSLLIPVIGGTIPGLVVCRLLQGMGTGPVMATIASFCAQRFAYKERTYVAAFQGFAVSTGIAVGLVFSPTMLKVTGNWQAAMAYDAILPVIGMVFALIVMFGPKSPVVNTVKSLDTKNSVFSGDLKKALGYTTFWILLLMFFIDSWSQQAYLDIAPAFYGSAVPMGLGLDPLTAGSKLAWASYAMMAGTLVAPVITEKIFKGNAKPTVFIGLIIASVSVLGVRTLSADSGLLLVVIPCIILFFSSFVNPTVMGFVAKNYPDTITGRLGGLITGLGIYGAAIGVAVGSVLLGKFNSYIPNMDVLAVLMCLGAIVVLFLRKPKGFEDHMNSISRKQA